MKTTEFKLSATGRHIPHVVGEDGVLTPVWLAPLSLSQEAFIAMPEQEGALVGPRGSGKTEAALIKFLAGIGQGYGASYAAIFFRKTVPQLRDIEKLSHDLIRPIWPTARYNQLRGTWTFPGGETLEFFHFDTIADFDNIQGRQFAFIFFEEGSLWPLPDCYLRSFSSLRSIGPPSMPRFIGMSANPLGAGHNWVKSRFRLRGVPPIVGQSITDARGIDGELEKPRRAIHAPYTDNVLLRHTEPEYMRNIVLSSAGDEARLMAWSQGNWDVVSGGAFDNLFLDHRNSFILADDFDMVPNFMSYDHGSSKPWSCGFWRECSGGEKLKLETGKFVTALRGDLVRVGELYGCVPDKPDTGTKPQIIEILQAIFDYKFKRGWITNDANGKWIDRCKGGVADTSIFDENNEFCVATEFNKPVRVNAVNFNRGIEWQPADKGAYSRRAGFQLFRERLMATTHTVREKVGMFVIGARCPDFMRTIPVLQRDEKVLDDVGTKQEDHIYDECRYALRYDRTSMLNPHGQRRVVGV